MSTPNRALSIRPADDAVTELGAALLPRTDPAVVRALNRLYADATAWPLQAAGRGWRLRWCAPPLHAVPTEAFHFRLGPHAGTLALDVPSLETLLGESRSELLPRELRYVLLADALHAAAQAVEQALRLRFEWLPPESGDAASATADALQGAFFVAEPAGAGSRLAVRGSLRFADAAALDILTSTLPPDRAPLPAGPTPFDTLRLPLSFRLGSTAIRLREVGDIRPGDLIGIEDWSSSGAALIVSAELGGPQGRRLLASAEGSRITILQIRDHTSMNPDSPAPPDDAQDISSLPLDRLDALEVTLRFEVGELSLSLGELRGVRAGHVFDLGQALNRSPVRILAHGNVLGKGYLVAVGDRLGVRVSEFAPGEI